MSPSLTTDCYQKTKVFLSTVFKFVSNNLVYTLAWRRGTASQYLAPQTFNHPYQSLLQPFLVWAKTSSFNIPHSWRGGGGELNLDQTGMCHRRLKFITLFWSGKTQKGYPVLELPLYCIALYCIVLHCIVFHCIALHCIALHCIALHCIALHCIVLETNIMFLLYLFNQMSLPFPFSSIMFVQKSFKFSITVISLSYDICIAFQD